MAPLIWGAAKFFGGLAFAVFVAKNTKAPTTQTEKSYTVTYLQAERVTKLEQVWYQGEWRDIQAYWYTGVGHITFKTECGLRFTRSKTSEIKTRKRP